MEYSPMYGNYEISGIITGKDNPLQWYGENKHKIKLHSYTRDYIEIILGQKIKE